MASTAPILQSVAREPRVFPVGVELHMQVLSTTMAEYWFWSICAHSPPLFCSNESCRIVIYNSLHCLAYVREMQCSHINHDISLTFYTADSVSVYTSDAYWIVAYDIVHEMQVNQIYFTV